MIDIIIKVAQLLLSLSILVVLHELGHYIPAKLFKTKVEKFYLFFDWPFSLFKKKIGDTEYGIGALPLGGYVKIAGMIDESMDTDQMKEEPKPWEFRSKPSWQRLIIMLGGVTVNFILAAVIYSLLTFFYGTFKVDVKSVVGGYKITNPVMKEVGFKTGDEILSINGVSDFIYVTDLSERMLVAKEATIKRDGEIISLDFPENFLGKLVEVEKEKRGFFNIRDPFIFSKALKESINYEVDIMDGDLLLSINDQPAKFVDQVEPLLKSNKDQIVKIKIKRSNATLERNLKVNSDGKIEFTRKGTMKDFEDAGFFKTIVKDDYNLLESLSVGCAMFSKQVLSYWTQLELVFNPKTEAYKGVGGFIAIGNIFPSDWSWVQFWSITAFLSIMLGVLNLLPIPALDGGHVIFLLYEMVSGKKPSDKFMEYAQTAGFLFLISLVLFANGNDIFKALFN